MIINNLFLSDTVQTGFLYLMLCLSGFCSLLLMRIFHISRSTLKRWFSDPSFPCSLSPTGRKMWSSDMIMDWAMKKKNSRKVRATMESI